MRLSGNDPDSIENKATTGLELRITARLTGWLGMRRFSSVYLILLHFQPYPGALSLAYKPVLRYDAQPRVVGVPGTPCRTA